MPSRASLVRLRFKELHLFHFIRILKAAGAVRGCFRVCFPCKYLSYSEWFKLLPLTPVSVVVLPVVCLTVFRCHHTVCCLFNFFHLGGAVHRCSRHGYAGCGLSEMLGDTPVFTAGKACKQQLPARVRVCMSVSVCARVSAPPPNPGIL